VPSSPAAKVNMGKTILGWRKGEILGLTSIRRKSLAPGELEIHPGFASLIHETEDIPGRDEGKSRGGSHRAFLFGERGG